MKYTVNESTQCWEWTGTITRYGYGVVFEGRKSRLAHRVSYILANGEIPPGKIICHRCDNKKCVNPAHLYAGTQKDNMRDAIVAGTHVSLFPEKAASRGEKNGRAKLTSSDVGTIRNLYKRGDWTQAGLGRLFGVSQTQVGQIVRGASWS